MDFQYNPFFIPLVIAGAACVAFALIAWNRPSQPGSKAFFLLCLAMSSWSIEYALELGSPDLTAKLFWAKLQFASIALIPVFWLVFVLQYTGRTDGIFYRNKILLLIIPLITLLLTATNSFHGLMIRHVILETRETYSILIRKFGPWFWLHAVYCYLLVFSGTIVLIHSVVRFPNRYRGQSIAITVAALAPLAGNAVYLLGLSPFPSIDLAPFIFALSCMAFTWSAFRGRFLDIMPIAYDKIVKSMSDSVLILDNENKILDMNSAAQTVLGKKANAVIDQPVEKILAPWPRLVNHFKTKSEKNEEIAIDTRQRRRYFDLLISPVYVNRYLAGRLAVFRDITKRKQFENAVRESEERFRSAFHQALMGIALLSLEGKFLAVNAYLCDMIGYPEEELLKMQVQDAFHTDDLKPAMRQLGELLDGQVSELLMENRFTRKDGEIIWGKTSTSILRDPEGNPVSIIAHIQNITEAKRMEEEKQRLEKQTRSVQRLEAIGTLAGGIAHDFNNILMSIQGSVSVLRMRTDANHSNQKKLLNIEEYVNTGASLTRQLLGFARSGKYEVKTIRLNDIIQKTSQMFARTRKEVRVTTRLEKDLWRIRADESQIEQILLNLYVNASQAMADGGTLYLDTANVLLDETYLKPFRVKPGRYVKVIVTDTGVGMDASTQERIFEPFFTTKEMGRGTGLGLASVYGIIKNHHGYINVYSEEGVGTTFNIYFPASDQEAEQQVELPRDLKKGNETILFVDDEEAILTHTKDMLVSLGYKVLTASDGREALKVYNEYSNMIDLVILDMIMPNLGGKDTFFELRSIKPDLKVLLASGYSINDQVEEILDNGCDGFIQKPFDASQLSTKVRSILDDAA